MWGLHKGLRISTVGSLNSDPTVNHWSFCLPRGVELEIVGKEPLTTWQRLRILFYIFLDLGIFHSPFWVRRGVEMILSHMASSSLNMSLYRAIWTHFRSNSIIPEQIKSQNSYIWTSRFPEHRSLFAGKAFSRKLCASENDAEPYRQSILGPD